MKKFTIIMYTLITSIWFMLPLPASSSNFSNSPEDRLRSRLQPLSQLPTSNVVNDIQSLNTVARFYKQRHYQLIWLKEDGPTPQGELLLNNLRNADRQGLNPVEYQLENWDAHLRNIHFVAFGSNLGRMEEMIRLDIALTQSFLKFASDLQHGRLYPDAFTLIERPNSTVSPELIAMRLNAAIREGRLESFFQDLSPRHSAYQALKKSLARYETIKTLGGWPLIPEGGPTLKVGSNSPRVPDLRRRLLITGDLPLSHFSTQEHFDEPLDTAVKKYQQRNGLLADGIVGSNTIERLNIPVEKRITQIKLNMERWRWLPADLGERHLMVNIPGFELQVIENRTVKKTMRAIVGRKKRQTPVISSSLTYLEFNPFWNIPQTIAKKDILPKVKTDPDYLTKNSIQVLSGWDHDAKMLNPQEIDWQLFTKKYLPFRLRQAPAPYNALGKVKFMFPNHHSVYIHDTPGKTLFDREMRSFSSGCVRVEHPLELAHALLKDQEWDLQRISKSIDSQKRQTIVMKKPIPVHLVYFTSWIDGSGELHFRQDIYDRDQRLLASLAPREPVRLWCGIGDGRCEEFKDI